MAKARLSASEALEHVLREGAETCEVLGLPRGGVSTRDKGLSTLTRCGLGARCGPSALAVPDVRGRVDLRQGHDRICLICREEDSPRECRFSDVITFPIMGTSKSDVILHPQRMRLIGALARGVLTTRQLAVLVPDIPQASLYRHLSTLLEAGVVEVAAERSVRGIVERSYSLVEGAALLTGEDVAEATRDDLFRYFSIFATGLIAEFGRYLERESIDLEADRVGYREMVLQLTDDEFAQLVTSLSTVLLPLTKNEAGGDRTPRLLAYVLLPLEPRPEAVL